MKRTKGKLLLILLLFFVTTSFAQLTEYNKRELRQELFELVNELRLEKGSQPLSFDSVLKKAAQNQSDYMAQEDELTHSQKRFDWSTPRKRVLKLKGNDFAIVGENVLFSKEQNFPLSKSELQELAKEMFLGWKNSPGHYANMIDPEYRLGDFGFKKSSKTNRIYAAHVFGKKGIRILGQISKNAFGLKKTPGACGDDFRWFENIIANMGNDFSLNGNKVIFYYHDIDQLKQILTNDNDGIAIDIIDREQLLCDEPNQLDFSPIYDGVLLEPVYKKELFEGNKAESDYRLISKVGELPENLRGKKLSLSVVLLKEGGVCRYLCPGKIPRRDYSLRPFKPTLFNPLDVSLKFSGIIRSQDLSYNFNSNVNTPLEYPRIKNIKHKVHSVTIQSYSSVEGDSLLNASLHNARAHRIKEHILSKIKVSNSAIEIDAKENWEKMDFQLKYYFADHLAELSKDSLKTLLDYRHVDNSLPWDSLLFEQRASTATINYWGTIKDTMAIDKLLALNIRSGIANQDYSLVNKAMFKLAQNEEKDRSILLEQSVFDELLKREELVQNAAALFTDLYVENLHQTTLFLNAWIQKSEELSEATKTNLLHLYTLVGVKLLNTWDLPSERLSNVIHPKRLVLMLNDNTETELALNTQLVFLKYYGQINDDQGIGKSFNYIEGYFRNKKLKINDLTDVVLFFNNWSRYDLTIKFLLERSEDHDFTEEAVFILLQTSIFYDLDRYEDVIEDLHKKAISLNKERWCNWLNKDFQLLRDHKLKRSYCEFCN